MWDTRTPLEPGHLDRRVTIQQVTDSVGTSGFPVESWATLVAGVPMGRASLRGMERVTAGQVAAKYDARWVMHYRADMDPDLVDVPKTRRLVFEGRVHDITAAEHIGRKDGIELTTMSSTKAAA